jgi:hypothetical protein
MVADEGIGAPTPACCRRQRHPKHPPAADRGRVGGDPRLLVGPRAAYPADRAAAPWLLARGAVAWNAIVVVRCYSIVLRAMRVNDPLAKLRSGVSTLC